MKVLIDTNVLISAALFPGSFSDQAYRLLVNSISEIIICDYELKEMKDVFSRKFPGKIEVLNQFIEMISEIFTIVEVPEGYSRYDIRDKNDEPILRTALYYDVDIILTGDKDFAAVKMNRPEIVTPKQYIEGNFREKVK